MSDKQLGVTKSLVIGIAIIVASLILGTAIKDGTYYVGNAIGNGFNHIGGNLSVTQTTATDGISEFGNYLSEYEASAFLRINIDDFTAFIQSGELDETFTMIQGRYVFSKEKLTQWLDNRIGNK